ncbi:MAG: hypothetical protein GY882_11330, partial [Actinomycetia bacterium]|nr:hypothetical protein [Actinomycetes bacterium]
RHVVVLDPKPQSDLSPIVDWLVDRGASAETVNLADHDREADAGLLDPFGWSPNPAAHVATLVLDLFGSQYTQGLSVAAEIRLKSVFAAAVEAGAACGMDLIDALAAVTGDDDAALTDLAQTIRTLWDQDALVRAFIGKQGRDFSLPAGGLTLLQCGDLLDLPTPGTPVGDLTLNHRVTLGALRLLFKFAVEAGAQSAADGLIGGTSLYLDEAWLLLGYADGRRTVEAASRLGRSQGLRLVLGTQRPSDLLAGGADLEDFLSRVFVGQITDPAEKQAALKVLGLLPTQARLEMLSECGPSRQSDGTWLPAMFLHRDVAARVGAIHAVAGIGADLHAAMTTDLAERRDLAAQAAVDHAGYADAYDDYDYDEAAADYDDYAYDEAPAEDADAYDEAPAEADDDAPAEADDDAGVDLADLWGEC